VEITPCTVCFYLIHLPSSPYQYYKTWKINAEIYLHVEFNWNGDLLQERLSSNDGQL
jgi:hypothetical protein